MVDLTGKTFGMLTVVERAKDYVAPSGYKLLKWKCRCECGRQVEAIGKYLKNGSKTSCGCDAIKPKKEKTAATKVEKTKVDKDKKKFVGILGSIKYRKKCYIQEIERALTLRYGVEDLKEWVQDPNMLDTLAACGPDIEILLKYLYKNTRMSFDYLQLFKGMDLQDPATKAYCINLAVRELVLSAIMGEEIEEECTEQGESEAA